MTTAMTQSTIPLLEIMNREDPKGNLLPMVQMLAQTNHILMYADWARCNANLTMKGARDATEPSPTDAGYDEGAPATFGTSEPYEEPTTMLKDNIIIDVNKVRDRGSGKAAFMNDEYRRHFEGFRKTWGARVFYGDRGTYPKRLRGFHYRGAYNTVSSDYVFDNSGGNASATANKTSVYVIKTGSTYFQFTYPEHDNGGDVPAMTGSPGRFMGSAMGFWGWDFGIQPALDGNNRTYPAFQTYWQWRFGMVVHDPRAIARICNISTSDIDEVDDYSFNYLYLMDVLGQFKEYFGNLDNTFIVVPSIVETQIAKAIDQKSNAYGSMDDPFGRPIPAFNFGVKVPICTCDAITKTESKVS